MSGASKITITQEPMFWKKKKESVPRESKIILGMILLQDDNSLDVDSFRNDFKSHYDHDIRKSTGDNSTFIFTIDGESIAIAHMPVAIPQDDIGETAKYAYNWQNSLEDTKDHKSHLIVSLIQGGQDQINRFRIFTQVLSSLLRTTEAIGIYKGNQSLLIPKSDYLREAELMSDEYLPINLWVYFGLRVTNNGNSGYTYGLKEFNKVEMEILNSVRSLEDIRGILFNTVHYVLEYDITFKDGQTVGGSKDEKITISFSNGQFVAGDTFKLAY